MTLHPCFTSIPHPKSPTYRIQLSKHKGTWSRTVLVNPCLTSLLNHVLQGSNTLTKISHFLPHLPPTSSRSEANNPGKKYLIDRRITSKSGQDMSEQPHRVLKSNFRWRKKTERKIEEDKKHRSIREKNAKGEKASGRTQQHWKIAYHLLKDMETNIYKAF